MFMEQTYFNLNEIGVPTLDFTTADELEFTGDNFFTHLEANNVDCNGDANFMRPPIALEQQTIIPKDHLVSKEYVDSLTINGNKLLYLNQSQTDPVYTTYKGLSLSIIEVPQRIVSAPALNTTLVSQFMSPELNITRLQSGLFTLNQFGKRTGNAGTVQFYFELCKFPDNILLGTSGLSNNITTTIDLFTMVLNLTSTEFLTTDRLIFKLYSKGIGASTGHTVSAYFQGEYYSFLVSTLGQASELLGTDNVWSGQNYYENPPNAKEMATTDMVSFTNVADYNVWTNTNRFTKAPSNTSAATTSYCDNLALSVYSSNNTWGQRLFTNETNSLTQLATTKFVKTKAFIPNINNTFSGVNTFPEPTTANEPANTRYVQTAFNESVKAQDNTFVGTQLWTKAIPGLTNVATTSYMVARFLNDLTLSGNVSVSASSTNDTHIASSSTTRTIFGLANGIFLAGNNAMGTQTFPTQASTNNSTRIATTEFTRTGTNLYDFLSSINSWSGVQNFPTAATSNTQIATTAFCDSLTYTMNNNAITGIHTVQNGTVANLDYTNLVVPSSFNTILDSNNTWTDTMFPTPPITLATKRIQTCSGVNNHIADLLTGNQTWSGVNVLPEISNPTGTLLSTTAYVLAKINSLLPTNFPTSNITGIWSVPYFFIDNLQLASCQYVAAQTIAFEDAGNEPWLYFTAVQRVINRTTPSTLIANTNNVANKITEYFTPASNTSFVSTIHSWANDNFFNYPLSTLENSTLGATCSYVNENLYGRTNNYGSQTWAEQPILDFPPTAGQIGYTRNFSGTKFTLPTGFSTLIDFGTIGVGNYLFVYKITIVAVANTNSLNFLNIFWGTSAAAAERNFSQMCGSNAWNLTPNYLSHGLRLQGTTTINRCFVVPFVSASTLIQSIRITGTYPYIASIRSDVSITEIL